MKNLLLLGPRTNKLRPELTGGVIVLFEQLISDLDKSGIHYKVIDLNSKNYSSKITATLSIYFNLIKNITHFKHISIHGTASVYYTIAPIVLLFAKLLNKKTSLRKFAGNFNQYFENCGIIKKQILKWVLKNANLLFFETKYLVRYFSVYNNNTLWFPNVRSEVIKPILPRVFTKKFVFISHVCKGKGVDQILEASLSLDKSYIIDIYGPITANEYSKEDFTKYNVNYKGPLESKKVLEILNTYDVLLLPSYRSEEGYPGIIIEAFSLAIPVISTNLKAISEICVNGIEGVLIEPKNAKHLAEAIVSINSANYEFYSGNAYLKFKSFRSDIHTQQFINYIDESIKKNHEITV